MSDTLIKVENLYKKFCCSLKRSMYYGTIDTACSMFGIPYNQTALRQGEFWALQGIKYELKRGETIGIIDANGSLVLIRKISKFEFGSLQDNWLKKI